MALTNVQQSIVKNVNLLKTFSFFLGIFGALGLVNGVYSYLYKNMAPDVQMLNGTLVLFAFGTVVLSYLLYMTGDIIERLTKGKVF